MVVGWILRDIIYVSLLGLEFERFYMAVNEAVTNSLLEMTDDRCSALRKWISNLEHHSAVKTFTGPFTEESCDLENILKVYANILEASETAKGAFQILIMYHCMETFVHTIITVYTLVQLASIEVRNMYAASTLFVWILKNFMYETVLSVESERFYMAVNDAVVNSLAQITNDKCSEQERRMYKNICRMSRVSNKFEVCNLFGLDATMPRKLLSLIATYTIVLLQFIFL
ncbi:uncharacterized protein LOC114353146 [Ostrinia furnacalis]|uniref:uncharacterized protein LOC114353146 n=1 Tax=Ostrinia furnacalis TaxID=93504 RepID=UPI00103F269A|nr:uncharacterized protein LOC114353146 [Ostrinia furnacalis]